MIITIGTRRWCDDSYSQQFTYEKREKKNRNNRTKANVLFVSFRFHRSTKSNDTKQLRRKATAVHQPPAAAPTGRPTRRRRSIRDEQRYCACAFAPTCRPRADRARRVMRVALGIVTKKTVISREKMKSILWRARFRFRRQRRRRPIAQPPGRPPASADHTAIWRMSSVRRASEPGPHESFTAPLPPPVPVTSSDDSCCSCCDPSCECATDPRGALFNCCAPRACARRPVQWTQLLQLSYRRFRRFVRALPARCTYHTYHTPEIRLALIFRLTYTTFSSCR